MEEIEKINQHVARTIQLTEEEKQYFNSLLQVRKVKKRQHIVQPGFVCKLRSYIAKGAMRAYVVDNAGQEHTIRLGVEDWWISDYSSYIFQQPATFFVEALEECTLVQIDYFSEQALLEKVPKFERFFRLITQRGFAFLQQRLVANLSRTAEERYEDFLVDYPTLAKRLPQYVVASYLGMSSVYLSQLRNHRTGKKSAFASPPGK